MSSNRLSVLLSPAARTSLGPGSGASENLNASLSENNDAAEKRERTRSRLVEIQLSSPRNSESRNSFGSIAGLNAVQLAEHYTSCMKLSNENKINAKNAFQLQLIDYMAMMLKKKESELDNFQVASCTLDASTKIYAYRVDSIHNDAIKMAGGLLRTDNKKKADDDGNAEEADKENAEGQTVKKKRTARRCATVESNLKNLNSKEVDKDCKIDPFFKRMATRFDEGQSAGCHFLANLRILDDSQEIVLSSDIIWWRTRQTVIVKPNEMVSIPIPNFEGIRSSEICPTFSPFTFIGWSPDSEDSIVCSEFSARFGQDQILGRDAEHAFDMNAVPEPVETSDNEMPDVCDDMEVDNDLNENTVGTVEVMGCMNQKKGKSSWEFMDLRNVLSTDPQEYSYFQKGAMIGWAGPSHWKIRPLIKSNGDQPKVPGKKKPKVVVTLNYETMASFEADFEPADKPICLTDGTVDKWTDLKTTLPEDLHLGVSSLLRLFLKPNMAIHAKKSGVVDVEGVGQYNFDNENDRENYCTNLENDDNISDDDNRDASAVFPIEENEKGDLSQAESGYDLVQAPNMVANVYIPYAKRAKKMDMKRLQKTIFKVLTHKDSKKEEVPAAQEEDPEQLKETSMFSEVYEKLPKKLPPKEAQNLSFALAFVALLHLANDKTLKIEDKSDLSDLVISQDKNLC